MDEFKNENNIPVNNPSYYQPVQHSTSGRYVQPQNPNPFTTKEMMYAQTIKQGKKRQCSEITKLGFLMGGATLLYLIIQLVAASLLNVFGLQETFNNSAIFQYSFSIVGVELISVLLPFIIMYMIIKKHYTSPLLPNSKVGFGKSSLWFVFGLGACMLANYAAGIMIMIANDNGYELTQSEVAESKNIIEFVIQFIAIGVVPGICEEIALRGCALGALKKYGKGFSIFAVSIVFGLMHGNVIQFVFAFLVGLVLGFITIKTDNIFIGMFVHAANNSLSVLASVLKYYSGEKASNNIMMVVQMAILGLGILSAIILACRKELSFEKETKNVYDNGFWKKTLALIPGLLPSFVILIIITATTIVKSTT